MFGSDEIGVASNLISTSLYPIQPTSSVKLRDSSSAVYIIVSSNQTETQFAGRICKVEGSIFGTCMEYILDKPDSSMLTHGSTVKKNHPQL